MKYWRTEFELFFEALRESFIATLPFVVLTSVATLLFQLVKVLGLWAGIDNLDAGAALVKALHGIFPAVILISIAWHLAKRYNIDRFSSVILALVSAVTVSTFFSDPRASGVLAGASLRAISVPIVSTLFLRWMMSLHVAEPKLKGRQLVAAEVAAAIRRIWPFASVFVLTALLFLVAKPPLQAAGTGLHDFQGGFSDSAFLAVRMVGMHLLGFLGIHGGNTFDLVFDTAFLSQPMFAHLSYKAFFDLFVVYGGTGAGLSLLIALVIGSKDRHGRRVAKLAAPFVLFNIAVIEICGWQHFASTSCFPPIGRRRALQFHN